jgi:hypothetical protein
MLSVNSPHQLLNALTKLYETWYVYHGTCAHFKGVFHKFLPSVCVYICIPLTARQRLGKNVTAAMNTYATIQDLLDASFSVRSVSYQRKVGDQFFPELLVISCHIFHLFIKPTIFADAKTNITHYSYVNYALSENNIDLTYLQTKRNAITIFMFFCTVLNASYTCS